MHVLRERERERVMSSMMRGPCHAAMTRQQSSCSAAHAMTRQQSSTCPAIHAHTPMGMAPTGAGPTDRTPLPPSRGWPGPTQITSTKLFCCCLAQGVGRLPSTAELSKGMRAESHSLDCPLPVKQGDVWQPVLPHARLPLLQARVSYVPHARLPRGSPVASRLASPTSRPC
jgi:hypothetical protein